MCAQDAQKNDLKPWRKAQWVLPPKANAAFGAALEDVREVYTRPYDPQRPVVGFDEARKQLVADVTPPLPLQPSQPARVDYEYERWARPTYSWCLNCWRDDGG